MRSLRRGVSFIELLIVIAIVAAVTGVGSMYYRQLMDQGNEERVRIDLRTIKKAILKLENEQKVTIRPGGPHPQMEPADLGVNEPPDGFTIPRLLDFRLLTRLPRDPWGNEYEIDIPEGRLFSLGPDMTPDTSDEISVVFRPPFEAIRARVTDDRQGIIVEFNRKVDPYSLYVPVPADLPFILSEDGSPPAAGSPMTTASRVMTNPFAVMVRLDREMPPATATPPGNRIQVVDSTQTQLAAMDTALVANLNTYVQVEEF